MSPTLIFTTGALGTLAIGLGVVGYVKHPLEKILAELCGSAERAAFWTAFAAVSLSAVPVIFAIACRPVPGSGVPAVFEIADQLKWGLIGLMGTLMMLGWVIGWSIAR
jgi:hypothetical protein